MNNRDENPFEIDSPTTYKERSNIRSEATISTQEPKDLVSTRAESGNSLVTGYVLIALGYLLVFLIYPTISYYFLSVGTKLYWVVIVYFTFAFIYFITRYVRLFSYDVCFCLLMTCSIFCILNSSLIFNNALPKKQLVSLYSPEIVEVLMLEEYLSIYIKHMIVPFIPFFIALVITLLKKYFYFIIDSDDYINADSKFKKNQLIVSWTLAVVLAIYLLYLNIIRHHYLGDQFYQYVQASLMLGTIFLVYNDYINRKLITVWTFLLVLIVIAYFPYEQNSFRRMEELLKPMAFFILLIYGALMLPRKT